MSRFLEIRKELEEEYKKKYNSLHIGLLYNFDLIAAKIYAEECCVETLKQADKRVKAIYETDTTGKIVLKTAILHKNNITLL